MERNSPCIQMLSVKNRNPPDITNENVAMNVKLSINIFEFIVIMDLKNVIQRKIIKFFIMFFLPDKI